jgi:hypothetical protein
MWKLRSASSTKPKPAVTWDSNSFVVHGANEQLECRWADVAVVRAWKDDCLTFDSIVVGFFSSDSRGIAVPEEVENFTEFLDAAPTFLPGFNWWASFNTVAFPPFEANLTTVWTRQTDAPASTR